MCKHLWWSGFVFSILVDEATNRTMNLIWLYVLYTWAKQKKYLFWLNRLSLCHLWGTRAWMFTTILGLLNKMHLDLHKLVVIATDEVASITREWQELVARLRENVPQLMGIHCIVHRKALAVQDANKYFPDLNFIVQAANGVYEWLGESSIWRRVFQRLLEAFCDKARVIVQLHDILVLFFCSFFNTCFCWVEHIILRSNASMGPFEYPQHYLNSKEEVCKARVNEWIMNQI